LRNLVPVLAFALAATSAPEAAFAQSAEYPLARAASELGYTYTYSGFENAAVVARPGLSILVRPGQQLAEVNDRLESLDGIPRIVNGELYVPETLVAELRRLARQYPANVSAMQQRQIVVVTQPAAVGAVSLDVRQLLGSYDLTVAGKAPPSVPVTLALIGTFSRSLPDVLISRSEVSSDLDGRFQAIVSIAPGFFSGGILTLVATSLPGVTRASAQIIVKEPNWKVTVPGDDLPKAMRDGIYPSGLH
jgi:hypothetical protein